ncbi:MAG: bifunctional phosphopantothenoylcysteine decarboxylase/phosphopantothenate--cysteine ligase CoaBC [Nitrospirae bacterium]|nr:bifunctional phosphopantothenoylcysteine decarboxylase/phosphopantothenate--cysteine ligase CoaBC [Nitrospirota bacterium]
MEENLLSGKRILLGVTGSIAAYKAVDLLRRLTEQGAEVRVAMTTCAEKFVSRLTFETLSRRPVLFDEFTGGNQATIGHIGITDGLDLALVAPATANIIGKIAAGIADDALTSALMAIDCPLLIAPAMNDRMYRNPRLQRNIAVLKDSGVRFVEPGTGSLACGTEGKGRLADIGLIIQELAVCLTQKDLAGKTVLVTAGPTREFIDAVRFISNPSTGKMGYALAAAARDRGAEVILITGPTQLAPPWGMKVVSVVSAGDMHRAVTEHLDRSHIVIMAAAVSDFKPLRTSDHKIKKEDAAQTLELGRTEDILLELGKAGGKRLLIGFAAETDNIEQNALKKLKDKHLDMIVVNDLLRNGSGFGVDTNAVTIIDRSGKRTEVPTMPKTAVASSIMNAVSEFLKKQNPQEPTAP